MSIPEFSTRFPTTITMATLAVVLVGWLSFDRLGTDLFPDLRAPVVTVVLKSPGKSPGEIEERYTRRLERNVTTVAGVRRVTSVTRAGQCAVVAEFAWDADMDFALLDVQKQVAGYAGEEEVESVDVSREDPRTLPVVRIAVQSGDRSVDGVSPDVDALMGLVETVVKPRLEGLAGVASAAVEGGAEREARVILDPYLLAAFGQDASQVARRIRSANLDVSGGSLKDGRRIYQVKGLGRLKTLEDISDLIIDERRGAVGATSGGESATMRVPVRVKDVGRVELRYPDRESIVRLDGEECVGLAIFRESSANTVTVVKQTRRALDELSPDLPGVRFTVVENQARFIEAAVSEVESSALIGGLLAVGILLVFLRDIRATIAIGIAIPVSVLATFTLMYFRDITLNVMSLGGLALGAGMLVDNAIIVMENIYRRLELGDTPMQAAAQGASEVGTAILAATLTTVAVFLPVVYLHGLEGELFREQAWTVTFALLSSLVVAMTTVPMLAARLLKRAPSASDSPLPASRFSRALEAALNHRGRVFLGAALLLGAAGVVLPTLRAEFVPREDQGHIQIELALPQGTRLEVTDGIARRVSAIVADLGGEDVRSVYAYTGDDPARDLGATRTTGPNRATLSIALSQDARAAGLLDRLDPALRQIPDLEVSYSMDETSLESLVGGGGAPIEVEIAGDDLDLLGKLTNELGRRMQDLPALHSVRTSFQGGEPELDLGLRLDIAASFGLTPEAIIETLTRRLSGEDVGELEQGQRTRTIRVGFEDVDLGELGSIRIDTPDGAILTVSDLADPHIVEGPREILREGQRRFGRVGAWVREGVALSQAVGQVKAVRTDLALPVGYRVEFAGEERTRAESFAGLQFALLLSLVLIYMVMASLFESLLHPFTVMLTLPLAGLGVVFLFGALDQPLSVMALIGIIMLGGIAVNDAIILVDRINQIRASGRGLREAVSAATVDRLRPILMTSATTVLALFPMAIGVGEGARMRAPMAQAVVGGLISSTLMTLFVIPVVYETVEAVRGRVRLRR